MSVFGWRCPLVHTAHLRGADNSIAEIVTATGTARTTLCRHPTSGSPTSDRVGAVTRRPGEHPTRTARRIGTYIGSVKGMAIVRITSAVYAVITTLRDAEEAYGLHLMKTTGLPSGTIYPILARLEDAGWVSSTWTDSDKPGRPRRRVYQLTPEGIRQTQAAGASLSPAARALADVVQRAVRPAVP